MSKYCICNPINRVFNKKGSCACCGKPFKRIKIRRTWKIKPQTKIKKSNKIYNRKKAKRKLKKLREE